MEGPQLAQDYLEQQFDPKSWAVRAKAEPGLQCLGVCTPSCGRRREPQSREVLLGAGEAVGDTPEWGWGM